MRSLMGGSPLRESIYRALFREEFPTYLLCGRESIVSIQFSKLHICEVPYCHWEFFVYSECTRNTYSKQRYHTMTVSSGHLTRHSQMSQNHVASRMHWNLDYALLICDCHYCDCLELPMFVLTLNLVCVCPRPFCYAYPDEDKAIPKIDFNH